MGVFDENLNCYFHVAIGADLDGNFSSVQGIGFEFEMETYAEGGRNDGPLFFRRNTAPQRLVREGGIMSSFQMELWMRAAMLGTTTPVLGLIQLCNEKGVPMHGWTIADAYPVKYEGPILNALEGQVAVSRIELMHTGLLQLF